MTLFKGSSYETVPAFDPDPEGRTDFRGLKPRPIGAAEPILEHSVAIKERLDSLSYHYYRESRAWLPFAEANSEFLFPEDLLWLPDPKDENGRERLAEVIVVPRRQDDGT